MRIAGLWLGPPVPRVSAGTSRRSAGWRMLELRVWISPSGVSLPLSLRLSLNSQPKVSSGECCVWLLRRCNSAFGWLVDGGVSAGEESGIASFSLK